MKARTMALDLMHLKTGHHREFNVWHDYDHQPEVLATVPDVFSAQFWVAPKAYVDARPTTALPFRGGEYVNIYWSQGSPEELINYFYLKGKELRPRARMTAAAYMDRVWSSRLHVVSGRTNGTDTLSADAVACAWDTGLIVSIEKVIDPHPTAEYPYTSPAVHDYDAWLETDFTPAMMDTGLLRATFHLVPTPIDNQALSIRLYYTGDPDPEASFVWFQRMADEQRRAASLHFDIAALRREIFLGAYRRVLPGQYDSYE
jgi:hypothetical protein